MTSSPGVSPAARRSTERAGSGRRQHARPHLGGTSTLRASGVAATREAEERAGRQRRRARATCRKARPPGAMLPAVAGYGSIRPEGDGRGDAAGDVDPATWRVATRSRHSTGQEVDRWSPCAARASRTAVPRSDVARLWCARRRLFSQNLARRRGWREVVLDDERPACTVALTVTGAPTPSRRTTAMPPHAGTACRRRYGTACLAGPHLDGYGHHVRGLVAPDQFPNCSRSCVLVRHLEDLAAPTMVRSGHRRWSWRSTRPTVVSAPTMLSAGVDFRRTSALAFPRCSSSASRDAGGGDVDQEEIPSAPGPLPVRTQEESTDDAYPTSNRSLNACASPLACAVHACQLVRTNRRARRSRC
jgi:hypothetical protein